MSRLSNAAGRVLAAFRYARRHKVSRQGGFALLIVTVTVAILGAVVGEFGYNARLEYEAAANSRDQLRAEYAARSGIHMARILIKVQQSILDRINAQIHSDLQITEFAPMLLGAFGGSDEEKADEGSVLGLSGDAIKAMSLGKGVGFDAPLDTEDGKLNINCGGGLVTPLVSVDPNNTNNNTNNPNQPQITMLNPQQALFEMLGSMLYPARYNRLFEHPGPDGQYYTRDDIVRAIIDWSDIDQQRFEPFGPSTGGEDYHYDQLKDPYKPHNNYFDTLEELHLVKGVSDEMYDDFSGMFTVYGGCQVNMRAVSPSNWPLLAGIIRASAVDPNNPLLADSTVMACLAQNLTTLFSLPGTLIQANEIADAIGRGGLPSWWGQTGPNGQPYQPIVLPCPGVAGVPIDQHKLAMIARTGARQVYRLESTGTVKRPGDRKIRVKITAIFDTMSYNQNTTSQDPNDRRGTWKYWRVE